MSLEGKFTKGNFYIKLAFNYYTFFDFAKTYNFLIQ